MFIPSLKTFGKLVISVALLVMVSSCSTEQKNPSQVTPIPQKKIALVIGNANYEIGKLDTPLNDATDMTAALQELGFEVILLKNSPKRQMDEALDQFSTRINQGYVALFYYAGHGMQVNGENYLIPVKAQIEAEKDVKYESMPLGKILDTMESAGNRINIVILDACRDNPYRKFRPSFSRGLTTSRGLTIPTHSASGTLIVFATAPEKIARNYDRKGRNGLFTSYLLKYIKTPNLKVNSMLEQVGADVAKETKYEQIPWVSSSLTGTGEFILNKKLETTTPIVISSSIPKPSPTPVTTTTSKPSPPATFSTPKPQSTPSPQLTAQAFYNRGNSKDNSGHYREAIADYNQAIKLKPDFAYAYHNRGFVKSKLKDHKGAIADYNQAIKLKPDYANAYSNRGASKNKLKDYKGAIADYNKVIELKPDAYAYYNRGNSKKALKDYRGAITDFRQAAKLFQQYNNQTYYQRSLARIKELGISN